MATTYLPPRPTAMDMSQAGGAATDPYAQIAQQLQEQLSLSQGLQQAREAGTQGLKGYTQGQGSNAVATLVNPSNRAEGQSPVQGLSAGANLNDTFKNQLDTSLQEQAQGSKNILDTLTTLMSLKKQQKQDKMDEQKYKLDLAANGFKENADGDIVPDLGAVNGKAAEKAQKDADGLRAEFMSQGKINEFLTVKNAYQKIESAEDNAAGDLGLIFNYMKILDPGSTVREGEFANAQNSAGVPDQVKNAYNKAISGVRLNPTQRSEFKRTAAQQFNSHIKTQRDLADFYKSQATKRGVNPEDVTGVFGQLEDVIVPALKKDPVKVNGILDNFMNGLFGVPQVQRPPLSSFEK